MRHRRALGARHHTIFRMIHTIFRMIHTIFRMIHTIFRMINGRYALSLRARLPFAKGARKRASSFAACYFFATGLSTAVSSAHVSAQRMKVKHLRALLHLFARNGLICFVKRHKAVEAHLLGNEGVRP